jgi:hypothetical protein
VYTLYAVSSAHFVLVNFSPPGSFRIPLSSGGNQDSSVAIGTGYELDDRGVGVRVPVGSWIFSSPRRPDRLWDHPASYPMGPGGPSSRGVKLTTHLQLVPRSSKCGSIHPLPHTPSWRNA